MPATTEREERESLIRLERAIWERRCRSDFTAFCIEALAPMNQAPARHHRLLIDYLERLERGEITRLMVFMPPGHAKSTYASVLFPAWFYAQEPHRDMVGASYASSLAEDFSKRIQVQIRHNAPLLGYDLATENVETWRTTNGGVYRSAGVGGGITGRRSDCTLIDDPLKGSADAESETMRESQKAWYRSEVYPRRKPGSRIGLIMTRWHPDDLGGWLLEEAKSGGDAWVVLKLPAICDSLDDPLGRRLGEALWPEWQDETELARIRSVVGEYVWGCTPAETPILMADWTMKPIAEVQVGDRVIGFEQGDPKARARVVESTVTNTQSHLDQVCDLVMDSGRKVRCTADHRWFTGRKEPGRKTYDEPKVGRRLMLAYEPLPPCSAADQRLWDYLAGIIDGEGHVGDSALWIDQAVPRNKPVADKIRHVLDELGLSYHESQKPAIRLPWSDRITFAIGEVRDVYRKVLAYTESAKAGQMRAALLKRGHMFIRDQDRVQEIRPGLVQPVYALTTTTGNYIAWGYASSNSLYQQDPRPRGASFFPVDLLLVPAEGGLVGVDGKPLMVPVPMPDRCDVVYSIIDTAIKAGQQHNSTAVTHFSYNSLLQTAPVNILDWDIVQIEGAKQADWLPSVFARGEELARSCGARRGYAGAIIEDKATGTVLLQQSENARREGKHHPAFPIDSKLTAMGKEERAIGAAPYVVAGDVKITDQAYNKTTVLKGRSANHFIVQIGGFRLGSKETDGLDLLDTFCYGVLMARGSNSGARKGI